MDMISYWKSTKEIYTDDGLTLITGYYDHKNQQHGGEKALGIHWESYPQSRGILSPCVIPGATRSAILAGLLHQAVINGDMKRVASLTEAIGFLSRKPNLYMAPVVK
tara:strand:+ start:53 stop:373 length:321 start_codon:yes stop_codon:yes gene_type:complete